MLASCIKRSNADFKRSGPVVLSISDDVLPAENILVNWNDRRVDQSGELASLLTRVLNTVEAQSDLQNDDQVPTSTEKPSHIRPTGPVPQDKPGAPFLNQTTGSCSGYEVTDDDSTEDWQSNDSDSAAGVITDMGTREIELVIAKDFDSYTVEEQDHLLAAIKQLLNVPGDILVRSKRRGSVRLTLLLTPEKTEQLYWAVKRGELEGLGVVDAKLRMKRAKGKPRRRSVKGPRLPSASCAALSLSDIPAIIQLAPGRYFVHKGFLDRVMAAMLLILGLPAIVASVLLVRLTSRGPGIFRQTRVGKNGKPFEMYKIRTMHQNAEAATGPVWSAIDDPRVTLVGRILRKLHLDDLPQLVNVIRGEMSLIGPRPAHPEFVPILAEAIPGYVNRFAVRPGITGLAQINLPPVSDLNGVRRHLVLDLDYVREASFLLDLRMFLCTLVRLWGLPGDTCMRLFHLRRAVSLPADAILDESGLAPRQLPMSMTRVIQQARGKEDEGAKGNRRPY